MIKNYYEIFSIGLPKYNICKNKLKNNYISLLKIIHPNNWAYSPNNYYKLSEKITSELNHGFTILNDDILRGKYLLIYRTGDKNILNQNLKYVYTSDFEVNTVLKELHYIEELIIIYKKNKEYSQIQKVNKILDDYIKIMSNKYESALRLNDRMYLARFYLLLLEKCIKLRKCNIN
jgi:hypothetical protein